MKTELIVATYNSPHALTLCLTSVARQTVLPNSICIADDGSGPETKAAIDAFAAAHPALRFRHVWHEDKGFEKAAILNKAIATSDADFLIFIDGDVLIHPTFIARHLALAERGRFSTGSLIRLDPEATASVTPAMVADGTVFDRGWLRSNRAIDRLGTWLKTMPLPRPVQAFLDRATPVQRALCGANASLFRDDALKVNGYDTTIKYGGEDKEFGIRLGNAGDHRPPPALHRAPRPPRAPAELQGRRPHPPPQGAHPRGAPRPDAVDRARHRPRGAAAMSAEPAPPAAYVINLDRAAGRWAFMAAHCRARGLDVRRVPAVDSRALAPAEIERHRIAEGIARPISADEVACFESHKKAWRTFLDTPEPWALILEDDVYLAPAIAALTARLAAADLAPIVKLNAYPRGIPVYARPVAEIDGYRLLTPAQKTIDASAYLISRAAAAAALARFDRYAEALDLALFDPATGIPVAQVMPAASVQQKFASFPFLEGEAQASALDGGRAEVRGIARRARGRRGPAAAVAAEAGRFFRRRIQPRLLWLTNRFRPPERRLAQVMIAFPAPARGSSTLPAAAPDTSFG